MAKKRRARRGATTYSTDKELIAYLEKNAPEVLQSKVSEAKFGACVRAVLAQLPTDEIQHFYCRRCGEYHLKAHPPLSESEAVKKRPVKRRTRRKPKSRSLQKIPTTSNPAGAGRHIRPIAKALGALIVALVGIGGVLIETWPNVYALPPDEAIELSEPYKQPFSLHNGGALPIYDAEVLCYPEHETVDLSHGQNVQIKVTSFHFIAGKISHGDHRPFTCDSWQWLSGIGPEGKMFTPPKSITAAD